MMTTALHSRITNLAVLFGLWMASFGHAQLGEERTPYTVPLFGVLEIEAIDSPELEEAVAELPGLLSDVADHADTNAEVRGRALALAFAVGAHKLVIDRDHQYRFQPKLTSYELPDGVEVDENGHVPMIHTAEYRESDENGDGNISRDEADELMLLLFPHRDKDGDGVLTPLELSEVTAPYYPTRTLEEVADDIEELLEEIPNSSPLAPFVHDVLVSIGGVQQSGIGTPDWRPAFPGSDFSSASASTPSSSGRASSRIYFEDGADMASSEGSAIGGYKKRQSLIKGLLVVQLEGSQFAGGASQMNATVTPGVADSDTTVIFNQEVGVSMDSGLVKVLQYIKRRHGEVPEGHRIEISFESQYSSKDGDSASTACALMIDSLITGEPIDPGFAVTGALSMDGEVEAVGGIDGKIRGATNRDCTHVAIPKVNDNVLSDMLITDGIGPLAAIQVFTIDTFDSAHALATPADNRDAKLNEAIETFATVQKVLLRNNGVAMLKNVQVQQRLRKVVELAPNHASARLLLLKALGRSKSQLTLEGSLMAIDRAALPLIQGLRNQDYRSGASALDSDEFGQSVSKLKRIRPQLDKRAWDTADAITEFAEAFRILRNNPPKSPSARSELAARIESTGNRVERHYGELVSEIRRQLGITDEE